MLTTALLIVALILTLIHAQNANRCPLWIPLLIAILAWLLPPLLRAMSMTL